MAVETVHGVVCINVSTQTYNFDKFAISVHNMILGLSNIVW